MLCSSGEMCLVMYVYHDKLLNLFLAIDHICVVNVSIIQIKKIQKLVEQQNFPAAIPNNYVYIRWKHRYQAKYIVGVSCRTYLCL